jgi:hypothetical protein
MNRALMVLCFALPLAGGCTQIGSSRPSGAKADVGDNPLGLTVTYAQDDGRVRVSLPQPLADDEQLYLRLRRGRWNTLDCSQLVQEIDPIDKSDVVDGAYLGPTVDASLLSSFYGPEWGDPPTDDMIAAAERGTDTIIDTCLVKGDALELQVETDFTQAWDAANGLNSGAADSHADTATPEVAVHSVQKYAELCVAELGEIPFFQKTGDGQYTTYSCLDSTPIPMTVTDAAGMITKPEGQVDKCDKPQYIYSLCEQGPRVAHRVNPEGTHWVLLCRKSVGGLASSKFNDMAMIGHNPLTGKTCFFQNALYSKTDGAHVPHPADKDKSATLWDGVHGGLGSGIECAHCHDNDPFIHSPWIDGALDNAGKPVVPKMGIDPDFALGYNDGPYSLVNAAGQGWTMEKQLVSPEANACTKCHRIGSGRWLDWASRLDGTDEYFRGVTTDAYLKFDKLHWMPSDLRAENLTEATWPGSKFQKSLDFIKACNNNRDACKFAPVPVSP